MSGGMEECKMSRSYKLKLQMQKAEAKEKEQWLLAAAHAFPIILDPLLQKAQSLQAQHALTPKQASTSARTPRRSCKGTTRSRLSGGASLQARATSSVQKYSGLERGAQ